MSEHKNEVTLVVGSAEAVAIVNLLGSLPTSQEAYPLWKNLKTQLDKQIESVKSVELS